jgi:MoaA/NifB/PqqE/SkfB family radical SAM enzyme
MKTNNFFLKSIPRTLKVILGAKVPLRVTQYITERCNLDCLYCSRHESGGQELATDEVKSLMASFRKAGTLFWAFNGGEALMRDDIGDLVNFAKNLGLFVNISTNGTLLARNYREIRNADLINITLEGPKEIHDEMRSRSYDMMCKGVEALARNGIRFTFTTQINNRNIDSLGFILNFAERYQTKVVFQPIRIQKEDGEAKSRALFPTREKMQQTMDYLLLEKTKGRHVASSANFLRQIKASWPTGRPDMNCWAGKLYCSITPEGAVTACCDTLQAARKEGNGRQPKNAVEDFYLLPAFQCSTCYASTPLEANIAMSTCLKSPLSAIRQVKSFLPRSFWNARR